MPKIVPIVEGTGEEKAVPVLCYKLLHEMERYEVLVDTPKSTHGRSNLTKPGGLEKFLEAAFREKDCAAVLVLLDADTDCAYTLARNLSKRVLTYGARVPVVIVAAKCEYEAWFLASLPAIIGRSIREQFTIPPGITFAGDVEVKTGVKEWLTSQIPPVSGYKRVAYDEALDQTAFTRLIDPALARSRSRSFRRLCHAIEQIVDAIDNNKIVVTPEAA